MVDNRLLVDAELVVDTNSRQAVDADSRSRIDVDDLLLTRSRFDASVSDVILEEAVKSGGCGRTCEFGGKAGD